MALQPRNLDEARIMYPLLAFFITAQDPGGLVTLELIEPTADPEDIPQAMTWSAPTELECWQQAFPPVDLQAVPEAERFASAEGTRAHQEEAVSFAELPEVPADNPPLEDPAVPGLFD
jgi:hypothetical protein